jgi:hypothetical protein
MYRGVFMFSVIPARGKGSCLLLVLYLYRSESKRLLVHEMKWSLSYQS